MELYRLALETLLERRDIEREILASDDVTLSRAEKENLLQDFAYWLLINGHSDATLAAFTERVSTKLKSMAQIHGAPELISAYLLERSGVLRQATIGRVDFLHRTFQEYLAARVAIEEDNIGLLISRALDDQWRQVIILAAGHANVRQRKRLIVGLIEQSDKMSTPDAHRLRVLAVACRETALELPEEVRNGLDRTMRELFPPRTEQDANYLAAAGADAIPYLKDHFDSDGKVVALCIRTLTRIGEEAALSALSRYGKDGRPEVIQSLIWAWGFFDQEEFARRVLADSPFKGPLSWRGRSSLGGIQHLKNLEELSLSDCLDIHAIPDLSELRHLAILRIENSKTLRTLKGIEGLASLEVLTISGSNELEDLSPLAGLRGLKSLSLEDCRSITDISPLACLGKLVELELSGCYAIQDLSPLGRLSNLRILSVPELSLADSIPEETRRRLQIT